MFPLTIIRESSQSVSSMKYAIEVKFATISSEKISSIKVTLQNKILISTCIFFHFQPEFYQVCHTKKQYDEYGPSIARHNPVFGTMS